PKTIAVAKFIHIFIYLILLLGSFTAIPLFFMLFVQGILFMGLFIVLLDLFLLFPLSLAFLIYVFVLKVFLGPHFSNTITYIQIAFVVCIIVGYQLIIRTYG